MKKSILALLLAVLMVASLLPAAAMADEPALTVGANETYETIGAAVVAASSGDTIYIKNGTYNENVTITGKALTLVGESQDGVVIKFDYETRNTSATYSGTQCYPIVSSNSDLTLENLTIAGPTNQHHGIGGVLATAGLTMSNVTVKDIRCTADNAEVCGVQYGRGIMVDGSGDVSITNCKVIAFQKNAIDVNTTGKVVIDNNIIEGVGSQAIIAQNGIVARKGNVTITNNEISGLSYTADNEWKYGSVGVYPLSGVTALTITGNAIDAVDSAMYVDGVDETVLAAATIKNNTVTNPPAPVSNETQGTIYATIQEAVNDAGENDVIVVAPGTYNEVVTFGGKSLTIKAQYPAYYEGVTLSDESGQLSKFTGTFYTGADSNPDSFNKDQSITIIGFALSGDGLKIGTTNWSTVGSLTVKNCTMEFGNNLETTNYYNKFNKFIYVNGGENGAFADFVVEDNYIGGTPLDGNYPLQLWGVKSASVRNNVFELFNAGNHQAIGISKLAADANVTVNNNKISGAGGGIYVTTWKCGGDSTGDTAFSGTVAINNNIITGAGAGNFKPIFVGYEGAQNGAFEGTLDEGNNTNNGETIVPEVGQKPGATAYYEVTYYPNNGGDKMIQLATHNQTINLPAAPSKSGYAFLGWDDGTHISAPNRNTHSPAMSPSTRSGCVTRTPPTSPRRSRRMSRRPLPSRSAMSPAPRGTTALSSTSTRTS